MRMSWQALWWQIRLIMMYRYLMVIETVLSRSVRQWHNIALSLSRMNFNGQSPVLIIHHVFHYDSNSVDMCSCVEFIWNDDVIKWKHFPPYWPFVRGIHRSLWIPHTKGQWRGALTLSLICAWMNGWVNNNEAGNLRRHHAHYDVTVM